MPQKPLKLLLCALAFQRVVATAAGTCPPIALGEGDLDGILGQALGSLKTVVETSHVTIVPEDSNCYLHIALTTKDIPVIMPSCQMTACSIATVTGTRIALRAFDISGCDAVFNGLSLPRHVPTAYADGSQRILKHCGADGFEFRSATPRREGHTPMVSVELQAASGSH